MRLIIFPFIVSQLLGCGQSAPDHLPIAEFGDGLEHRAQPPTSLTWDLIQSHRSSEVEIYENRVVPPAAIQSISVDEQAKEMARILDAQMLFDGRFGTLPSELQFSCAVQYSAAETTWFGFLKNGSDPIKAIAARVLWTQHSRRHASDVMNAIAVADKGEVPWAQVHEIVESDLREQHIEYELVSGDRKWGSWLAGLRPDPALVPILLELHEEKPTADLTYALGASQDSRVLARLISELQLGDYMRTGYAAKALGLWGDRSSEPNLIAALSSNKGWARAHICGALGSIGTIRSLAELGRIANDPVYTGAINVRRSARDAIEKIVARQ